MSIWYIFQIHLFSAIYEDKKKKIKLLLATKCENDDKYRLTSSEVSFSLGYGKRPTCVSIG
jgi:hypothetical protein